VVKDDKSPPVSDPRWAEWSKPLLEYLAAPHTWKEMRASVRMPEDKLRNCLIWLEIYGLVVDYEIEGVATWIKTGGWRIPGSPGDAAAQPGRESSRGS
jgi:uncharacterized protein YjeT (DUF2065 family)